MTPREIIGQVARKHGIAVERILGRKRDRITSVIRFEAYHELQLVGLSLPQIGRACGGRHHTTVLAGLASREAREPWTPPVYYFRPAELVSAGAGL